LLESLGKTLLWDIRITLIMTACFRVVADDV
jgi:hypothetical protein